MTVAPVAPAGLEPLAAYLEEISGLAVHPGNGPLVLARLAPVVHLHAAGSVAELVTQARADATGRIRDEIIDAVVTGDTTWFREGYPFEFFRARLLPRLAGEIRDGRRRDVRIWSAGCSTGQEPCSIAMVYLAALGEFPALAPSHLTVIATDLSLSLIEQAKQASFSAASVQRGLPPAFLARFFEPQGRRWAARPELRERIEFLHSNVVDSAPQGGFDLVLCRYVLGFFSEQARRSALARCAAALREGGVLIVGAAETPGPESERFVRVEFGSGCCYVRRPGT